MFETHLAALDQALIDLAGNILWQDSLRRSLYTFKGETPPIQIENALHAQLLSVAPAKVTWQLFDHCASVTSTYAMFEKFVDDLVTAYVALVPRVWPGYSELDENLRVQYRIGVGTLLSKWGPNSMHRHLSENSLASGLVDGLKNQPYSLLPEAFLTDSSNYRAEVLNVLFSRLGINDIFAWVKAEEAVEDFCAIKLGGGDTADGYLNRLVGIRNEASHGTTTIVSVAELVRFTEFVGVIARALAARLRNELIICGEKAKCSELVGEVVHSWSNNVVGVKSHCTTPISLGQEIFAGKEHLRQLTVTEIQQNHISQPSINLTQGATFALRLPEKVSKGSKIYRRLTI